MSNQTEPEINPKDLLARVRRDLESVGRYFETDEQDLAKTAFHLSGLVLALEVCVGRVVPIDRRPKPRS